MKHQIVHTLQKYFLNPPIKIALAMSLPLPGYALLDTAGTSAPRICCPMMIRVSGNDGWRVRYPAAQAMHGQFACSGRSFSVFELIWIHDLLNVCRYV